MKSYVVKNDFSGLNRFVKALDDKRIVKVGVLAKKNSRTSGPVGNADLGAIHEFGSVSAGIPPRSWLRAPLRTGGNVILVATKKNAAAHLANGRKDLILKEMGINAEKRIIRAFETRGFGTWKPNKPATIKRKKSSAPLIDTGTLKRSVTSEVSNP